jgi:hypothetical protein
MRCSALLQVRGGNEQVTYVRQQDRDRTPGSERGRGKLKIRMTSLKQTAPMLFQLREQANSGVPEYPLYKKS